MSGKQMQYQKLGNSGLNISKIVVGCMSYGSTDWAPWVLADEEKIMKVLKKCYDAGLRTFDTADVYSNGTSEILLGKFIKKFNIPREKIVILSKCFGFVGPSDMSQKEGHRNEKTNPEFLNCKGLSRKHIFDAAKASVDRLGTYMDVLQIHRLDDTPAEEIMKALHDVIDAGYTRYIGASTMRATDFAYLQFTAEKNGWTKFISMQNFYNLIYREEEREMNHFCNKTGVGLIPWSPNAAGLLSRPLGESTIRGEQELVGYKGMGLVLTGSNEVIIQRVQELAKKYNTSMSAIATGWTLSKGCAPIVGISSEKRVDDYIEAVNLKVADEDWKYLEEPYEPKNLVTG